MATPAKKEKKACKTLGKWFLDPEISDVFKSNHPKNMKVSLHCLLCDKSVSTQPALTCSKLTIETWEQRGEICLKLTIKPPKRRQNEPFVLVFLLLTLNM